MDKQMSESTSKSELRTYWAAKHGCSVELKIDSITSGVLTLQDRTRTVQERFDLTTIDCLDTAMKRFRDDHKDLFVYH